VLGAEIVVKKVKVESRKWKVESGKEFPDKQGIQEPVARIKSPVVVRPLA